MTNVIAGSFAHDGLTFRTFAAGKGPPIVFLHGGGSRASNFRALQALLADRFATISFDMRGFGETGARPETPITHTLWAEDVRACFDHFGLSQAHLVGWSLGATVAMNFASRHIDRVQAMALLGAPHPERPINRALFQRRLDIIAGGGSAADVVAGTFESIAGAIGAWARTHRPEAVEQVRREHLAQDVNLAARVVDGYASRPPLGPILPKITCPVTLLVGDEDRTCDLAGAEVLRDRLPRATVRIVPECGHYYAVEQPERVAAMIAAAFNEEPPRV